MGEMTAPTTIPAMTGSKRNYYHDPEVREQIENAIHNQAGVYAELGGMSGPDAVDGFLAEVGAAFPDDRGYFIPEEGGWVIVKRPPLTSIPAPPEFSIWFARPIYTSRKFPKVLVDGRRRTINWPYLKARILTEHGELDLLPEEYVPCDDIMKFVELMDDGVEMHFLNDEPDEIAERTFYLRAHGLRQREATALLLGDMQSNHVYLTCDIGGN